MTLKTNFILQYAAEFMQNFSVNYSHMPNSKVHFMVKADDDTFLNLRLLGAILSQTVAHKAYGGKCGSFDSPCRNSKSKHYLSTTDYRFRFFPPHCEGPMYYLSADLVHEMATVSKQFHKLNRTNQDFGAISRFEDVALGFYLYMYAAKVDVSYVNYLSNIYPKNKLLGYFNVYDIVLEKIPCKTMFYFGQLNIGALSEKVSTYAASLNSSFANKPYFYQTFSFANFAISSAFFSSHIDSDQSNHSANTIKDNPPLSNVQQHPIASSIARLKLHKNCVIWFRNVKRIVVYHHVNNAAMYNLNFCRNYF